MNESVQIDLARAAPFRIGPLTVEPALRQVTAVTSETLEPRVMQVLVLLAMANGSIVSRDELVRQCWEGRIVGDDSINRVIARLRRLLEIHSNDTVRIETITKVGYRLIGAVAFIAPVAPPPVVTDAPAVTHAAGAPAAAPARAMRAWLAAALVLVAALAAGWYILAPKFGAAPKPIVAVLPFTDMSHAKGKAYFAEGLAEEILDTLAQDTRLKVLGGTTARAIRDNSADPGFARDKLGVTRLLEGSVRGGEGADNVKVSVRLIDTADGSEIWSQMFERSGADVVAVQEEVAQAVAVQLAGPLGRSATPVAVSTAKVPPAAYEKVLIAKQLLRTRQADSILKARVLANEAVALAPDYALAFATRSNATTLAVIYAGEPRSEFAAARHDAESAIKLDPMLADGFAALGGVLQWLGDYAGTIPSLKRAVALKPDDAEAHLRLGRSYGYSGDINRALIEFDKAVASDPLWINPTGNLVTFSAQAGQFDRARAAAKRFRSVSPDLADTLEIEASAAGLTGEFAHGLRFATAALERNPSKSTSLVEQTNMLFAMLAYDRISASAWAALSPDLRQARTRDLRKAAAMIQAHGAAAWDDPAQVAALSQALVQLDRPVDLVRAFDARFATVAAYLASPVADIGAALDLAAAFDRVGRAADARALRAFSRAKLTSAVANGTAASANASTWAVLLMGEGNRAGALAKLEAGVGTAWWQVCSNSPWFGETYPWLGERRALTPLNGDPRFEAVKTRCRTEINKQRKLAGIAPVALK